MSVQEYITSGLVLLAAGCLLASAVVALIGAVTQRRLWPVWLGLFGLAWLLMGIAMLLMGIAMLVGLA